MSSRQLLFRTRFQRSAKKKKIPKNRITLKTDTFVGTFQKFLTSDSAGLETTSRLSWALRHCKQLSVTFRVEGGQVSPLYDCTESDSYRWFVIVSYISITLLNGATPNRGHRRVGEQWRYLNK
jgi:hypothetical protein